MPRFIGCLELDPPMQIFFCKKTSWAKFPPNVERTPREITLLLNCCGRRLISKNLPMYPWNIPQTLNQQFMILSEFFFIWGRGDS